MQYAYVWEISGNVIMGLAQDPSMELRAREAEMSCRANRAFQIPLTDHMVNRMPHIFSRIGKMPTFERAREVIVTQLPE